MKILFLSFVFLFTYTLSAQGPSGYAKKVVEVLASENFAGRGYTHQGIQKAANEIESQFEKIGLEKYKGSFRQEVSYPINVLESCALSINGIPLELGRDFIPSGFSKTDSGTVEANYFDTSVIDSAFIYESLDDLYNEVEALSGKAVVFPTVDFPANYVSDGFSANDMYREVKYSFQDQLLKNDNKVFIEISPDRLTMGLSNIPKNTHHFIVKEEVFTDSIRSVFYEVKSHFEPEFKTDNLIGYIPGKDPSKKVLITAHYDHLGQIGDAIFTGANDNASGVAMMLSMAKYYRQNPPQYTMVFIAFTGEEAGLEGSKKFIENPPFPLSEIQMVFNFDIVGTGDEGIQIVNSSKFPNMFKELNFINNKHTLLANIKKRGEACNSDHCPFDKEGIPAIFTYTLGGFPYYHDIDDTAENLSLKEFDDVFFLFTTYINDHL